jgi:CRISPR-associated protein Cmr4
MGSTVGLVDLPIQRERITHYPCIAGPGLKGALRAEVELSGAGNGYPGAREIFGPDTRNAKDHAGAVSFGDARLLLFPVRSLRGVFAWTTSATALARYSRDLAAAGISGAPPMPSGPASGCASAATWNAIAAGGVAVLEEYTFAHDVAGDPAVLAVAKWLAEHALPQTPEYKHYRDQLLKRLVLLSEDDFRDFTQFATEVVTRVHLDTETKTVLPGQLWTEEMLPAETLLYAPLHCCRARRRDPNGGVQAAAATGVEVLKALRGVSPDRLQLGGDETVGRGIVCLRYANPDQEA